LTVALNRVIEFAVADPNVDVPPCDGALACSSIVANYTDYNARMRPWYLAAVAAGRNGTYSTFMSSGGQMQLSYSVPFYDAADGTTVLGVHSAAAAACACDLSGCQVILVDKNLDEMNYRLHKSSGGRQTYVLVSVKTLLE